MRARKDVHEVLPLRCNTDEKFSNLFSLWTGFLLGVSLVFLDRKLF